MTDLDRTLTTLLGEELARESDLIPPPLGDLQQEATRRRRHRWGAGLVGAAAAAAVAVAAVQLWPGGASSPALPAGPSLPEGAEEFQVPTYDWDGNGMEANVGGHLGFTAEGCTLLYVPGQPASVQPVVFPDAVGVRFANGVRAVVHEDSGRVYAVEGQAFEYAGGWVEAGRTWSDRCGEWSGDVATINDEPEGEPLSSDPPPPDEPAPTRLPTDEERGLYGVPTFAWDPAEGGDDALVEGTVRMTGDGCAIVEQGDHRVGLVLPNAQGKRQEDGEALIYSTFPGSEVLMAHEGMEISYAAGFHDRSADWERLCPSSPVDSVAMVNDTGG